MEVEVDVAAGVAHLSVGAGEDADAAHLDDGASEVPEEELLVVGVLPHEAVHIGLGVRTDSQPPAPAGRWWS